MTLEKDYLSCHLGPKTIALKDELTRFQEMSTVTFFADYDKEINQFSIKDNNFKISMTYKGVFALGSLDFHQSD